MLERLRKEWNNVEMRKEEVMKKKNKRRGKRKTIERERGKSPSLSHFLFEYDSSPKVVMNWV